jgi:hypothetical protein
LGNWHKYNWRVADADAKADGAAITFKFRPVNATEFPKVKTYPATFRHTLKLRVVSDTPLPKIDRIEAFTDSVFDRRAVRLAWKDAPPRTLKLDAFNGAVEGLDKLSSRQFRVRLQVTANPDPNTFDCTLVTVRSGEQIFTFAVDDLAKGPLFLPLHEVAVLPETDGRNYAAVAAEQKARGARTLYDRVAELPEQTWRAAWEGMPPKTSPIYFPLGVDGGRQRFRLDPDGSIHFRSNDGYLRKRPGRDTPRLDLEPSPVQVKFSLPGRPAHRTLDEETLPICVTSWDLDGIRVQQTALATLLDGARADGPVPFADAFAVFLARFTFTNPTDAPKTATFPAAFGGGPSFRKLRLDADGLLWNGEQVRGQCAGDVPPHLSRAD